MPQHAVSMSHVSDTRWHDAKFVHKHVTPCEQQGTRAPMGTTAVNHLLSRFTQRQAASTVSQPRHASGPMAVRRLST